MRWLVCYWLDGTDELDIQNVNQRYICRASPTGEKPNTDKG